MITHLYKDSGLLFQRSAILKVYYSH